MGATKSLIESLKNQLAERDQEVAQQRAEVLCPKEQNTWLLRQIFGKKSKRLIDTDPDQLKFDGFESEEAAKAKTKTIPAHERRTHNRSGEDTIRLPNDLPVETVLIDLPEEEKICKETGLALKKIGEEISHKLAHRPGSFFLKKIVRPKYAHPEREENGVSIASMPDTLLPKCRADDSLIAEIVTRKFVDHLPCIALQKISLEMAS